MPQPKGYFLYVNLPAAKVRERLKGFGHGVRKIQSGGRKQAVVIHTATGKHLDELVAKFADVAVQAHPAISANRSKRCAILDRRVVRRFAPWAFEPSATWNASALRLHSSW